MPSDWMALAFERFQSASRSLRLTLPPGRHEVFWPRFVDLLRMKNRGLTVTLLLDPDPSRPEALRAALEALPELEAGEHEVSWSAAKGLPFFLAVVDDLWSLVVAGDPDSGEGVGYVRLTDDIEETAPLRFAFDRRAAEGIWGLDPSAWLEWLRHAPGRRRTGIPLAALHRGRERLERAVRRDLRRLPRRSCWLIKVRDSAYGLPEPPGGHHWLDWVREERMALGWPKLTGEVNPQRPPDRERFAKHFARHYPGLHDAERAYAALRHFIAGMLDGDRVAAMEGWTAKQTSPVRFHGWTRVAGPAAVTADAAWPLGRPARWHKYGLDLPVNAVRQATGLQSATHPLHRLHPAAYRGLVALAEEVRRAHGDTQLLLEIALVNENNAPGHP